MKSLFVASTIVLLSFPAFAESLTVKMYEALESGQGKPMGTVVISQTAKGLSFKADLSGVPAGEHGFHVHEKGSCAPAEQDGKMIPALAAGGHYDPKGSNHHMGPHGHGHLGDLPHLKAKAGDVIRQTVVAPRLKSLKQIKGRAIMVHVGGDNYSDAPNALGGGGARFACGVIE